MYKSFCDLVSVGITKDDAILTISDTYKIHPGLLQEKLDRFFPLDNYKV